MNLISTVVAHLLTVAIYPRELIRKLRLLTQQIIASPKCVARVVRKMKNMGYKTHMRVLLLIRTAQSSPMPRLND